MTTAQPSAIATAVRRLGDAADLIEESGWVRHELAVDKDGVAVWPDDPCATRFCASGAVHAAFADLRPSKFGESTAEEIANTALDIQCYRDYGLFYIDWNDYEALDRRQVVRFMRRTARNLEARRIEVLL